MSFEEEKNKYLEMIKNDYRFLNTIMEDDHRYKMIVIDPKTDKELEFAKEIYGYINNSKKIIEDSYVTISLSDVDFGQYEYINHLKKIIMALKNRDLKGLEAVGRITPENKGRLAFQSYYLNEYYHNESNSFLANECGFNTDDIYEDSLDIAKFNIYKANAIIIFDEEMNYLRLLDNYPFDNGHGELEIVKDYFSGFNEEYNRTMEKVKAYYDNEDAYVPKIKK